MLINYFKQVEDAVKLFMEIFQSDLEYDKKALEHYNGEFLHASRISGTNMVLLDPRAFRVKPTDDTDSLFQKELACKRVFMFEGANTRFLHGKNGKVSKLSKEDAMSIFDDFAKNGLENKRKLFEDIKPTMLALDLKFYMQDKGRTWKSALREAWFDGSGSLPASLQRLRNYFDHDAVFKKIKPDMTPDAICSALCDIWNEADAKKLRAPIEVAQVIAEIIEADANAKQAKTNVSQSI